MARKRTLARCPALAVKRLSVSNPELRGKRDTSETPTGFCELCGSGDTRIHPAYSQADHRGNIRPKLAAINRQRRDRPAESTDTTWDSGSRHAAPTSCYHDQQAGPTHTGGTNRAGTDHTLTSSAVKANDEETCNAATQTHDTGKSVAVQTEPFITAVTQRENANTPATQRKDANTMATQGQVIDTMTTQRKDINTMTTQIKDIDTMTTQGQAINTTVTQRKDTSSTATQSKDARRVAKQSEGTSKTTTQREGGSKDATQREDNPKSATQREDNPKSATQREDNPKSATQREDNPKSATQREDNPKSATQREDNPKSATERKGISKSATQREDRSKDTIIQSGDTCKTATQREDTNEPAKQRDTRHKDIQRDDTSTTATQRQDANTSATQRDTREAETQRRDTNTPATQIHITEAKTHRADTNNTSATQRDDINTGAAQREDTPSTASSRQRQDRSTAAAERNDPSGTAAHAQVTHRTATERQIDSKTARRREEARSGSAARDEHIKPSTKQREDGNTAATKLSPINYNDVKQRENTTQTKTPYTGSKPTPRQGAAAKRTQEGPIKDTARRRTWGGKDKRTGGQTTSQRHSLGKSRLRQEDVAKEMKTHIQKTYPGLQERCYCVPPIHFNVARRAEHPHIKGCYIPGDTPGSNSRADECRERVLGALREVLDNRAAFVLSGIVFEDYLNKGIPAHSSQQPGKPIPIPLPKSADLSPQYRRGEVEMLIIDKAHGIVIVDIKAVGDTIEDLKVDNSQAVGVVRKVLSKAVALMEKSRDVFLHLVSDIPATVPVTLLLALPNLPDHMLRKALESDPHLTKRVLKALREVLENRPAVVLPGIVFEDYVNKAIPAHSTQHPWKQIPIPFPKSADPLPQYRRVEALRRCLITRDSLTEEGTRQTQVTQVTQVTQACLCSDLLPPKHQPATDHHVQQLWLWWNRRYPLGTQVIDDDVYETIVGRFCGPFSTVGVWTGHLPRKEVRTLGQAISETGDRFASPLLLPRHREVLEGPDHRLLHLAGPPGAGQTLVLVLKGAQWAREGRHVCVLSARASPSPNAFVIQEQIRKTLMQNDPHIDPSHVDTDVILTDSDDTQRDSATLVTRLHTRAKGRPICLIMNEIQGEVTDYIAKLCQQIPGCGFWSSGVCPSTCPPGFVLRELSIPVRCPPAVQTLLKMTEPSRGSGVPYSYVTSSTEGTQHPLPTSGLPVKLLSHAGHGHRPILQCRQCGETLALYLREIGVGKDLGAGDVLIVTADQPSHQPDSAPSLFLQALKGQLDGSVSLDIGGHSPHSRAAPASPPDKMTLTSYLSVTGLERKVVVFLPEGTASDNAAADTVIETNDSTEDNTTANVTASESLQTSQSTQDGDGHPPETQPTVYHSGAGEKSLSQEKRQKDCQNDQEETCSENRQTDHDENREEGLQGKRQEDLGENRQGHQKHTQKYHQVKRQEDDQGNRESRCMSKIAAMTRFNTSHLTSERNTDNTDASRQKSHAQWKDIPDEDDLDMPDEEDSIDSGIYIENRSESEFSDEDETSPQLPPLQNTEDDTVGISMGTESTNTTVELNSSSSKDDTDSCMESEASNAELLQARPCSSEDIQVYPSHQQQETGAPPSDEEDGDQTPNQVSDSDDVHTSATADSEVPMAESRLPADRPLMPGAAPSDHSSPGPVAVRSQDSRLRDAVQSLSSSNREKLWYSASRSLGHAVLFHF